MKGLRLSGLVVGSFVLVQWLGLVGSAASVSVAPSSVSVGAESDLVFNVGDSTQSPTQQVVITFPDSPEVKSVNAVAPPGWTSTAYQATGVVTRVEFAAGSLSPGASAQFELTFLIPQTTAAMVFKVQQTYADGTSTTPDVASVSVSAAAPTSTTESLITTTSTSTAAPSTTSTTVKISAARSQPLAERVGKVLIAIGVAVGIGAYLRTRRVK